jgi:CheY-like chemotaxis protein
MPLKGVLAVGLDSSLLANLSSALQSAGFFVTSVGSIRDAIDQFHDGYFDLVLLGDSIPTDNRERLTFLIRASIPRIPVVCVTDSSSECFCYPDAIIRNDSANLIRGIGELLAKQAEIPALSRSMLGIST